MIINVIIWYRLKADTKVSILPFTTIFCKDCASIDQDTNVRKHSPDFFWLSSLQVVNMVLYIFLPLSYFSPLMREKRSSSEEGLKEQSWLWRGDIRSSFYSKKYKSKMSFNTYQRTYKLSTFSRIVKGRWYSMGILLSSTPKETVWEFIQKMGFFDTPEMIKLIREKEEMNKQRRYRIQTKREII